MEILVKKNMAVRADVPLHGMVSLASCFTAWAHCPPQSGGHCGSILFEAKRGLIVLADARCR